MSTRTRISAEDTNSTTTPLGSGETFTGTAEQSDHPTVAVTCHTDTDCTLYYDFSDDGTNWTTYPVGGFTVRANTPEQKFGYNADVDAATAPEDIWTNGGLYTGQPVGTPAAISETVTLTSDDTTNDTTAGTGARTVTIEGLDDDGLEASETVTLTSGVGTTSGLFYRVNRLYVKTAGSGETNSGNITATHTSTTANVFGRITAGIGQSEIAAWTVPADKQALLIKRKLAVLNNQSTAQEAEIVLAHRPYNNGANSARLYLRRVVASTVSGGVTDQPMGGLVLGPLDDIVERVIEATADNLETVARFDVIY